MHQHPKNSHEKTSPASAYPRLLLLSLDVSLPLYLCLSAKELGKSRYDFEAYSVDFEFAAIDVFLLQVSSSGGQNASQVLFISV